MAVNIQRTLMLVKPDGVSRGLIGHILTRLESKGFRFICMKMIMPNKDIIREHYAEHADKPYYGEIESYIMMGPILAMIVEGNHAISACRKILGKCKPENAEPGTIRFDFAQHMNRNICHASDSKESADREIELWFKQDEMTDQIHSNDELPI
jgi:nucleoside-diphosphate kinase